VEILPRCRSELEISRELKLGASHYTTVSTLQIKGSDLYLTKERAEAKNLQLWQRELGSLTDATAT
jgi:hypothetical protein